LNKDYRLRLTKHESDLIKEYRKREKGDFRNVLCVGDLHEPFCLDGYLEHCLAAYEKYECNTVVLLGDCIDLHYSSFHTSDPDGYSAGEELDRAIDKIKVWYKHFNNKTVPNGVSVCIGNHDAIIRRKAFESGISKKWVRDYNEVLECPDWDFKEVHKIDGVIYTHGTGTSGRNAAANKALQFGQPTVQGHIHTEASIITVGEHWGMQVGCGVDRQAYAMAYSKFFPKTYKISCGVVLNNGKIPLILPLTTLSKQ
jgi:hypothetical protein